MMDWKIKRWSALFLLFVFVLSNQLFAQSYRKKQVKGKPIIEHLEVEWLKVNIGCAEDVSAISFPEEMIIIDAEVYDDLRNQLVFLEGLNPDVCIRDLPDIDFSKHSVIWCFIQYGGCFENLKGKAFFGTNNQNYILNMEIGGDNCRAIAYTRVFFKVPKIPKNSNIEYQRDGYLVDGKTPWR